MDTIRKLSNALRPTATTPKNETEYLAGLKGVYTIQTFIWVFLHTFVPAAVDAGDAENTVSGPTYQTLIRKTLSVLFWNENLLYAAFILLSARCICVPFIQNATGAQIAGSIFRRGIRLYIPTFITLSLVWVIFSQIGYGHISEYKTVSGNSLIETLLPIDSFVVFFNSVFNIFWQTNDYATQSGSLAFPTQTLWVLSVVFQQSYTVYMTMVIIPYTRGAWRVKALIVFILTAFWVQSWAWYSITGLLIADMVHNMDFKTKSQKGIKIWRSFRFPIWLACLLVMAAGLLMQYIWVAWRPEYQNVELKGHTAIYYSGGLNTQYDIHQPQARDDNYLILTGLLILIESSDILQLIMGNPVLVYFGHRSLSWFCVQSIIVYSGGIKLWLHLRVTESWNSMNATAACLGVCFLATIFAAEGFYRLVDLPSKFAARWAYGWIRS